MPEPILGAALIGLGGSALAAKSQKSAAASASASQTRSANRAIQEQRRQFNKVQKLLKPYRKGGKKAFFAQMDLAGLGDEGEQQEAIDAILAGPEFQSIVQQGEEGILQNAAATGGLRGGDTQSALAQFRPQVLSGLINQQYSRLGGLANMGQTSAAGVGSAAQSTGANISNLMQQQGAAQAGNALAAGQANSQLYGNIAGGLGNILGSKIFESGFDGGITIGGENSLFRGGF